MELSNQIRLNKHIFRLLKVNEIVIPIGRTNKGNLGLKFQANTDEFEIYLDAVPLSTKDILNDENNIELKKMLTKYLFEQTKTVWDKIESTSTILNPVLRTMEDKQAVAALPKPRGRPKGSKNK